MTFSKKTNQFNEKYTLLSSFFLSLSFNHTHTHSFSLSFIICVVHKECSTNRSNDFDWCGDARYVRSTSMNNIIKQAHSNYGFRLFYFSFFFLDQIELVFSFISRNVCSTLCVRKNNSQNLTSDYCLCFRREKEREREREREREVIEP